MKSLEKSKEIRLTEMNSHGNKTDEKFRDPATAGHSVSNLFGCGLSAL
jgi:hypothetical protein